jgi:hypothetical protein
MAAHQFNATARTIQSVGQQSNQSLVGGGVNGRSGNPNSQLVADATMRDNFIGGRAWLQLHRQ